MIGTPISFARRESAIALAEISTLNMRLTGIAAGGARELLFGMP
jgi:hypothetical protein